VKIVLDNARVLRVECLHSERQTVNHGEQNDDSRNDSARPKRARPAHWVLLGDTREYLEKKLGRRLTDAELVVRDQTMDAMANGKPMPKC